MTDCKTCVIKGKVFILPEVGLNKVKIKEITGIRLRGRVFLEFEGGC